MAEFREERVTTERVADDPVVVDRGIAADPVRRGNPAPVIAAICIGLLILFLVLFGMNRSGNDDGGGNDDGVRVTVPNDLDRNDGNDGGGGGGATNDGGGTTDAEPEADAEADAEADTGGTSNP